MARLIVVAGDPVRGTDVHTVTGTGPPNAQAFVGTGEFEYLGSMTGGLSGLVRVAGEPVALVTSGSSLKAGQDGPSGKHRGPNGTNFKPGPGSVVPQPDPLTAQIVDPIGPGTPSAGAGSALLTIDGVAVLLDGDAVDTCSGVGQTEQSRVTARAQDFVTCSA